MSANIKIGKDTVNGVTSILLENADSAGEYVKFSDGGYTTMPNTYGDTVIIGDERLGYIDVGDQVVTSGQGYDQLQTGTFLEITQLSVLTGTINTTSFNAPLLSATSSSAKFGCEIGQYYYELVIDDQDDLNITEYYLQGGGGTSYKQYAEFTGGLFLSGNLSATEGV